MEHPLLKDLNPEQQKAVIATDGCGIPSGPGDRERAWSWMVPAQYQCADRGVENYFR